MIKSGTRIFVTKRAHLLFECTANKEWEAGFIHFNRKQLHPSLVVYYQWKENTYKYNQYGLRCSDCGTVSFDDFHFVFHSITLRFFHDPKTYCDKIASSLKTTWTKFSTSGQIFEFQLPFDVFGSRQEPGALVIVHEQENEVKWCNQADVFPQKFNISFYVSVPVSIKSSV